MSDFFKQEVFVLPNWAWFAIAGAIALLLIAIIIFACFAKREDLLKEEETSPESSASDGERNETLVGAEEVKAEKVEEKEPDPLPTEEKPAAKPAIKSAEKGASAKPTADADEVKVYHVSRREDKKWEVRLEGGDKALKLFFTQKEAIDYTRKISGKKRIVAHKEEGGTREV